MQAASPLTARRSRWAAFVATIALVFLLALSGAPVFTSVGASPRAAGESIPGELIPILAGPALEQPTLVPEQPRDGARSASATFQVNYSGFTPQARAAFQRAVDIWATQITSSVPIVVNASFATLPQGVLGSAGAIDYWRNFTGAPQANTWYPLPLANKLSGTDLDPGQGDITANFSSNFSNWYYGTGATPAGQYNFTSVVLHELGHGLGFAGSGRVLGGVGNWGAGTAWPFVYDRAVYNGAGQQLISTYPNNSSALAAQYTGNALFFNGTNANAANGGTPPRLYAPSTWEQGSSYSHLDENTYAPGNPNSLMTPAISAGESIYDPGSIARGMFADMGWTTNGTAPACASPLTTFCDVPVDYWAYPQIQQFVARAITTGCDTDAAGNRFYCPEADVTRAEMAVFLTRTLGQDQVPATAQSFADVPPSYWAYRQIERLVALGITTGCGPGEYCPERTVSRAEMAAFIIRALTGNPAAPPAPATATFADVPTTHPQYAFIEEMNRLDITTGCRTEGTARYYCPADNVTRAEMAVFITRAFPAP